MKAPGFFTWMLPTLLLAILAVAFARWQTHLNAQHLADLGEKTAARIALAVRSQLADEGRPDPAYALAHAAIASPRVQYIVVEVPGHPPREFGSPSAEPGATHSLALPGGGRVSVGTVDLGWVSMAPLAVAIVTGTAIFLTLRLALFVRRREHEALARLDRLARDIDAADDGPDAPRFEDFQSALDDISGRVRDLRSEVREELERSTAELRATLEQSRDRNSELEIATRKALVASDAKSEFLANISHEVRSPMDAILGYAELLNETPLDPRQRGYLDAIEQAAETLLDIVDDVLNLSRIEAGKLIIHSQPFSIRENIDSVAQMLAPSAYRKGLDFVRIVDRQVPATVSGDPLRLRQVLVNLLTNAIKFTREGSVQLLVDVTNTDSDRATVRFAVSDTGIGISAVEQLALFEPFSRPAHDADAEQGTGLGLVITKRLCEAMQGEIDVASSPGRGSLFTARIPLVVIEQDAIATGTTLGAVPVAVCCADAAHRDWLGQCLALDGAAVLYQPSLPALAAELGTRDDLRVAVVVVTQQWLADRAGLAAAARELHDRLHVVALVSTSSRARLRDTERLFGGEALPAHTPMHIVCERIAAALQRGSATGPAQPAAPPAVASRRLAGLRILIAEDNRLSRDYLSTQLRHNGADIDTCTNGNEACEAIATKAYDLVLMDLRMPGCDGISAMRRLRASGNELPPVIGLTAASHDRDAACEAGMTECIVKPVRSALLLDYIATVTASNNEPDPRAALLDEEMRNELAIELPLHGERLRALYARRDLATLLEEAHKINGTAALCGFDGLRGAAATLERRLRENDSDGLAGSLAELLAQLDHVCVGLKA